MASAEPNVVPLCDILLVLLIIFMVITPMVQRGIDVKLPETQEASSSGAMPQGLIVLTLKSDMSVEINRDVVEMNMLAQRLREIYEARQERTMFLRADAKLPFRHIMEVIDIAKGAGVDTTGLIPEYFTDEEM